MAADSEEVLYCLCQQPYDSSQFMIECNACGDWFHGDCVGIEERQAADIDIYHCPSCQNTHGPLKLKHKRSRRIISTGDTPITSSIKKFVQSLKGRRFANAEKILTYMKGYELDKDYIETNGFTYPILVRSDGGLDLRVPPPTFTVNDIESYVGSMRELDVIDVVKQSDMKMLMREFVDYYNKPQRDRILNVISLEFSKTKLSDIVSPPRIVEELSWVSKYWPEHTGETRTFLKPDVHKYCLMSVADSYTDFHVDFGGTSVWYHVLKGRKEFYLIEPTNANLALYETWASSSSQNMIFFADQVKDCYKVVIEPGETIFIPSGWIHSVYTPVDSIVFGGNFLHDYAIANQLAVYEMESRILTPERFQFPNFETICWYAAKNLAEAVTDMLDGGSRLTTQVLNGCELLCMKLSRWIKDSDSRSHKRHKDYMPQGISHSRLLNELVKLVNQAKSLSSSQEELSEFPTKDEFSSSKQVTERQALLGLKFKFNKIDNSLLNFTNMPVGDKKTSKIIEEDDDDSSENSEEEKLKSCYSDGTYVYPSLLDSDDDEQYSKKRTKKNRSNTESWSAKVKVNNDLPKLNRPVRENARKIKRQLPVDNHTSDPEYSSDDDSPEKLKKIKKRQSLNDSGASTSSWNSLQKAKPKKGEKTTKQRLGKLLKIHKYY